MTTETLYKLIFWLILIMTYYVVLEFILIITDALSLSLVKKYVLKNDSGLFVCQLFFRFCSCSKSYIDQ